MDGDWVFAVVSACQRFVCATTMTGADGPRCARALRDSIPAPRDQAARQYLRATLIELAIRWGREQHRRLSGRCMTQPCVVTALANAPEFWRTAPDAGWSIDVESFVACVTAIAGELAATHGASLAQRAADLIRAHDGPISIDSTARTLGAHPATLRRAFQREFGMSAQQFLIRIRVERAEALLNVEGRPKVEPIAMAVGWRTKRGLYRAFRQLRGRTPGGGRTNIA